MPDGDCCLPKADGITYLAIGECQVTVGMRGLDLIFQQLFLMEKTAETVTDEELVEMGRNYNYIPNAKTVSKDYVIALRKAYAAYLNRTTEQKTP
jgi:hypothetical protein